MSIILLYAETEAVPAASEVAKWLRTRGYKARSVDATLLSAAEKERANAVYATDAVFPLVAAIYGADNVVAVSSYTDGNTLLASTGLSDIDPAGAPPAPPAPPPLPAPSSRRRLR